MEEKYKKHPVDAYVEKKLREYRLFLGMSQSELGKVVGVIFQQIQKYELGSNRIGSSRLYEFSQILTVHINYFFEGFPEFASKNAIIIELKKPAPKVDDNQITNMYRKETIELVKGN